MTTNNQTPGQEGAAAQGLLDAVRAEAKGADAHLLEPGEHDIDASWNLGVESPEDVVEATRREQEAATDDQQKPEDKKEADEDGFIEIPADEDGGEPTRVPLAEAIAAYQEFKGLEGRVNEVISTAEQRTQERAREVWQAQDQAYAQTIQTLQTWQQGLARMAPQPPPMAMLDQNAANYDPDTYHRHKAQYDQVVSAFAGIQGQLQQAEAERNRAAQEHHQQYAASEMQALFRISPEWRANFQAKSAEATALLKSKYGFDDETLGSIVDHRFFLAVNDLVRFHKLMASGKETKTKLEAKAPKLVRSQRESAQVQARGKDGKFVMAAGKALEDGPYSAEKGRAYFREMIRAGKI